MPRFRHFLYAGIFIASFLFSSNCEGELYEIPDTSKPIVKDAAVYVEAHKLEGVKNLRILSEPSENSIYAHFDLKISKENFLKQGWKKGSESEESFWKEEVVWDILHFGLEAPVELSAANVYIREDHSKNSVGSLEVLVLLDNEGYLISKKNIPDQRSYISIFNF